MRKRAIVSLPLIALCLALGLALLAYLPAAAVPDDPAAAAVKPSSSPAQPMLHGDLYQKLLTPVRLDFHAVPLIEVLRRLSQSTGVPIQWVDDPTDGNLGNVSQQPITLTSPTPRSLLRALQLAVPWTGSRFILLGDQGVRIVSHDDVGDQYVLETHELSHASDYTTQSRIRFIEAVRRDVTPQEWGRAGGPWIVPARSVFAVDVYHRRDVQSKIQSLQQWPKRELIPRIARSERAEMLGERDKDTSPAEWARQLLQKFPYASVVDRLEYERRRLPAQAPSVFEPVERRLASREVATDQLGWAQSDYRNVRELSLKALHSAEVEKFVDRPGAGVARNGEVEPGPIALQILQLGTYSLASAEIDPPSPERPVNLPGSARNTAGQASLSTVAQSTIALPTVARLELLHEAGLKSFLSPFRFGYVEDRQHVTGFGSHGFEYLPRLEYLPLTEDVQPAHEATHRGFSQQQVDWLSVNSFEPTEHWVMRRLELVSLLKHDPPRVYQSDNLPRMDVLQEVPTRALNDFEAAALPQLVASEDIVVRATTNRIEMVGAIRAARQCTQCHEVHRGQLLGAFSYTLVRDPLVPPAAAADAGANQLGLLDR